MKGKTREDYINLDTNLYYYLTLALTHTIMANDYTMAKKLIDIGAEPNGILYIDKDFDRNDQDESENLLEVAASRDRPEIFELLLMNGADPTFGDSMPFIDWVRETDSTYIQYLNLLEKYYPGIDINQNYTPYIVT